MINIKIIPLKGIEIENLGELLLGQSKKDIELLLGKPTDSFNSNQLFYDNYELRVDLDENGLTEFIEFIYGPFPEKTKLSIYGIDPFQVHSSELLELLMKENNGEIDDSEADYCFTFPNISIGVWRNSTETEVKETISEMKKNNEYEENKNWLEEDLNKASKFWTIGMGVSGYYK